MAHFKVLPSNCTGTAGSYEDLNQNSLDSAGALTNTSRMPFRRIIAELTCSVFVN
jgi:hypothetical protein